MDVYCDVSVAYTSYTLMQVAGEKQILVFFVVGDSRLHLCNQIICVCGIDIINFFSPKGRRITTTVVFHRIDGNTSRLIE